MSSTNLFRESSVKVELLTHRLWKFETHGFVLKCVYSLYLYILKAFTSQHKFINLSCQWMYIVYCLSFYFVNGFLTFEL